MAAILLAGGASSRMGRDKSGLLLPDGTSLLASLLHRLQARFPSVVISCREPRDMALPGATVVCDTLQNAGPLAGLHAALNASPDAENFVLACDMPGFDIRLADLLAPFSRRHDIVCAAHAGRVHPLAGWYRKECIPEIERQVQAGRLRVEDLLPTVRSCVIDLDPLVGAITAKQWLANVNTPGDWRDFQQSRF